MSTTVLVVDDDPDFLQMMQTVLGAESYEVVGCSDARRALELARRLRPAAAIVDLRMPFRAGWQLIQDIKSDPAMAHLPLIVCTAAVVEMEALREKLRKMGCYVLLKPFELDELFAILHSAIDNAA